MVSNDPPGLDTPVVPTDSTVRGSGIAICEPCWSLCEECFRPYFEHECTSCPKGHYLVRLISPPMSDVKGQKDILEATPKRIGICTDTCPEAHYPDDNRRLCER
ncbi:unnamed protein product [Protopolystoma xenopodis]|uniref:Uncharacterized protein n=1 Tax=Protopolystoma xenopodis TaxID=117903 RepID=A0A448WKB3_9PLAT|nr:unnamed protein product [Protopolystoma xenopodis]